MEQILTKNNYLLLLEKIKVMKDNIIWIHHPVTEDLIKVKVKNVKNTKVVVSILEDSVYYGQPDWEILKTRIIGIV